MGGGSEPVGQRSRRPFLPSFLFSPIWVPSSLVTSKASTSSVPFIMSAAGMLCPGQGFCYFINKFLEPIPHPRSSNSLWAGAGTRGPSAIGLLNVGSKLRANLEKMWFYLCQKPTGADISKLLHSEPTALLSSTNCHISWSSFPHTILAPNAILSQNVETEITGGVKVGLCHFS